MTAGADFDSIARNLAEIVDDVLTVERDRPRRLALIRQQIRRAMALAYRAARRPEAFLAGRGPGKP